MDPIIHLGRAQVKEFAQDCLKRIGLEVDQKEQELILGLLQSPFATAAHRTLPRLAFGGLVCGVELLIRLGKGSQQTLELRERQARESQKLSPVILKCLVCDHASILFLIPEKVNSRTVYARVAHRRASSAAGPAIEARGETESKE